MVRAAKLLGAAVALSVIALSPSGAALAACSPPGYGPSYGGAGGAPCDYSAPASASAYDYAPVQSHRSTKRHASRVHESN
jgi:hypothetical protein